MSLNLPTAAELDAERRGKPLTKPSKVARIEKKHETKAAVSKARGKAEKEDLARKAAIREACYVRDHGRCRACEKPVELRHDNWLRLAECHHMKYRSQQGSDELSNRITFCQKCHEDEHKKNKLQVKGDPNDVLHFTALNPETGQVLRVWQSEVPR